MDARITKFLGGEDYTFTRLDELYRYTLSVECSAPIKSGKRKGERCGRATSGCFLEDGVWKRKCCFHKEILSEIINEEKLERMENQVKQMEKNRDLSFLPLPNDICDIIGKKKSELDYSCYNCGEMPTDDIGSGIIPINELHKHSHDFRFRKFLVNGYGRKLPMCYKCCRREGFRQSHPILENDLVIKNRAVFPELYRFEYTTWFLPEQQHIVNELLDYSWTRYLEHMGEIQMEIDRLEKLIDFQKNDLDKNYKKLINLLK